jgi:hypothetical protein
MDSAKMSIFIKLLISLLLHNYIHISCWATGPFPIYTSYLSVILHIQLPIGLSLYNVRF